MSDTLSFRYFQFSGLSHEWIDNPSRKGETQCYSCQRLMPPYLRWLHTHSSARTQRGLETRIQHSVVLSLYSLNIAVQSYPCVYGNLPLSCHAMVPSGFRLSVRQVVSVVIFTGGTLTTSYRTIWLKEKSSRFND